MSSSVSLPHPLASYTPAHIPTPSSSRPSSPVYDFLVVLPSITRGFRPSSAINKDREDFATSPGGPLGRATRSNSHQIGGSLGTGFSGGGGGTHRASVPNTAFGGQTVRREYHPQASQPPLSSSRSSQNSHVEEYGPDVPLDQQVQPDPAAYRSRGPSRVVPSLFPRPSPVSSMTSRFGEGPRMGPGSGSIGSPTTGSTRESVPLSPGSVGPGLGPTRSLVRPSEPKSTDLDSPGSRDTTDRKPSSLDDRTRGVPLKSAVSMNGVFVDDQDQDDSDPTQQSRWNRLLVQHPHARRASIGNLAPSGMARPGWSGSEEDEEDESRNGTLGHGPAETEAEGSGRRSGSKWRSGSGLRRDSSLREKSSAPSSPTRSNPPADKAQSGTAATISSGLRTVSSTEGSSTRRSRRPQTSAGALSGTQTRGGKLGSRADARGQLEPAHNGDSERRGSISPGTVSEGVAAQGNAVDPVKLAGQLAPAVELVESASPSRTNQTSRPTTARGQSNVTSSGWGHLSSSSGLASPTAESAGQAGFLGKRSRGTGTGRPGWEGEEVVGVLREDGMPVTTFRSTTQMSRHLRNQSAIEEASKTAVPGSTNGTSTVPTVSSFASPLSRVLLVPLSDSPTLPSLSLLLAQGTTPSAICFQQDLLDRARRTEADWLPSALHMIGTATRRGSDVSLGNDGQKERSIHVIAYSANPALAPSVVDECLRAGAIGVLQPPYDNDVTLKKVRKMIMWAERSQQVRRSFDASEAGGAEQEEAQKSVEAFVKEEEHILEDAAAVPSLVGDTTEGYGDDLAQSLDGPTEADLATGPAKTLYSHLAAYDFSSRRRSVDNGGLSLALERAHQAARQHRFRSAADIHALPPSMTPPVKQDRSSSLAGLEGYLIAKQEENPQEDATIIAELLGEMYRQTRISIEIQMIDYAEYSAPLEPAHRERLVEALSTWNFRPHTLDEADLFRCACLLFEAVLRIKGLAELGIGQDQINRLLFAIRAIYHAPNPYHNYIHAVDVLQASYTFLVSVGVAPPPSILLDANSGPWKRAEVVDVGNTEEYNAKVATRSILRPQDVFAVMLAAMGHDVGHPGLSNVFMKNAKTPLSQVYEDKSVLENMHCMLIVQLLRKHGFGFLLEGSKTTGLGTALPASSHFAGASEDVSPMASDFPEAPSTALGTSFERDEQDGAVEDWKSFKKLLYSTVLATDMSIHFNWIKRFIDYGKRMRADGVQSLAKPEEDEARILLSQAIIKCADISNPTRPIEVSEHWSTVLLAEWANQATLEQELQLPVSVVASADAAIQAKGQIGFIDLFTLPLFDAAADAMPGLRFYADACGENRALWQDRFDAINALASTTPPPPIKAISNESQRAISLEERYRNLFPLSLPRSMFQDSATSIGSTATTPSTQTSHSLAIDDAALSDTHSMRAAYIENTTRRTSSAHLRTPRTKRFQP